MPRGGQYSGRQLQRQRATGPLTLYVKPTGSDTASGLTVADAFQTIQRAIDVLSADWDMAIFQATIQVRPGTYAENVVLKPVIGIATPTLQGDGGIPTNVVISPAAGTAVVSVTGALPFKICWRISGFQITTSGTTNYGLFASFGAELRFSSIDFGPVSFSHQVVQNYGTIECVGNYAVSGGSQFHGYADTGGILTGSGKTATLSGTPNFSNSFVSSTILSVIQWIGYTFAGTGATGKRYTGINNAVINTSGGGANYFPGDVAGSVATGGIYA